MSTELENHIKLFFGFDRNSVSREERDTLEEQTSNLVNQYGWDAVRQAFFHYVQTDCKTSEDIARVAYRYEGLNWNIKPVPDPYEFLGYLYYKAGFRKASYRAACALDDLATTILPASGYQEANIYYHPYYAAETDPKMIAAVERWRQREANGGIDATATSQEQQQKKTTPKEQDHHQ